MKLFTLLSLLPLLLPITAGALQPSTTPSLAELSIEELMEVEVISAARREQPLFSAPAAIFALTREDIRRSGATTVPEALRLVPGMHVARFDANKWALTARGFNDVFANKLLIQIDGRSVYTPVFSGVFWEIQDLVLEDVERIEVVRGPGGTLWGANAVNGIINIITQHAADTQGTYVQGGNGSLEPAGGAVRHGGALGKRGHYRIFAKYFLRNAFEDTGGVDLEDEWDVARIGARVDLQLSGHDDLTVDMAFYDGEMGQSMQLIDSLTPPYLKDFTDDTDATGGHLRGRWQRRLDDTSDLELQVYYDHMDRRLMPIGGLTQTYDVDFQHRFPLTRRQELIWGVGARYIIDDYETPTFVISVDPAERSTHLVNAFVQDELGLVDGKLRLIAGTKLEHNTYTGLEVQPNVRFSWTPSPRQNFWGAVSRAVRTPGRLEIDQRGHAQVIPPQTFGNEQPILVAVLGNDDFASGNLVAFDAGYRLRPRTWLNLDLAGFVNRYDDLRTNDPRQSYAETEPAPEHILLPLFIENRLKGTTHGPELAASVQHAPGWRSHLAYTYLHMDMKLKEASQDSAATTWDEENPNHLLHARTSIDLARDLELDATVRYVDRLPILEIDSYLTADLRLGWRPSDQVEFYFLAHNLLDSPHPEFRRQNVIFIPGQVEAGYHLGLKLRL